MQSLLHGWRPIHAVCMCEATLAHRSLTLGVCHCPKDSASGAILKVQMNRVKKICHGHFLAVCYGWHERPHLAYEMINVLVTMSRALTSPCQVIANHRDESCDQTVALPQLYLFRLYQRALFEVA